MDPAALDPPPLPDQPPAAAPLVSSAADTSTVANLTTIHASAYNHPPYAEMITAAISALNERNGSSKRAIAKYIESQYLDLPSTHDALLTYHLQLLKTNGQLFMVKHSYKLHRSAPAPVNAAVNAVPSDPASSGLKRRPGRPPKPRPDSVQVAVPVFEPPVQVNAVASQPNLSIRMDNGSAGGGQPVRGRGRPPKNGGLKMGPVHSPASGEVKRGRGRPPKSGSSDGPVRRGRGRPKAAAAAPGPAPGAQVKKGSGRPRGRPPKPINVVEGVVPPRVPETPGSVGGGVTGVAPVLGKRRGRPPRAGGEAKRTRQLSGKPLGRPKKNASATPVNRNPDSQLLMAYLDLKAKLENLQSRTSQTANLIKPYLTNEAAVNALQELELIAMNVTIPPSAAAVAQNQQPQPQPQPIQYPQQPES